MKPLVILNDHDYFAEITQKVADTKPGDRVALMVMSFSPAEPLTDPLMRELFQAAKRGVRVQLNVDANCFMVTDSHNTPQGPLFYGKDPARTKRADFRAKLNALERLRKNGGGYCITNKPKRSYTNPFAGRSHIKFTVINDTAYVGGCNMSKTWQLDLMVRIKDAPTVNWMYDFILDAARVGTIRELLNNKDIRQPVDNHTTLLIDAGIRRQSLIYEQALELIDNAKDWIVLTCQFFPGSTTAQHLAAARERGVDVKLYFGSHKNHGMLTLPHQVAEWRERMRHPAELFAGELSPDLPRLHTKLLASESTAIIGSHNFVVQGVNFGTAESALLRRDPAFARKAVTAFEARLEEARHLTANR